jgi:hypothetical protein
MPNPSAAKRTRSDSDPLSRPIALTEPQMSALLAAAYPLLPDVRSAFLEACAKEIAAMPELGDGALHLVIVTPHEALRRPGAVHPGSIQMGQRHRTQ